MELGTNEALKEAILAGLGITIISRYTFGLDPESSRYRCLDVEGFPVENHWYFAYPQGKQLSWTEIVDSGCVVAGSPALVWLTYLAFSPKVHGFVPTPPNPITGTLITLGVLAVGHWWTIARRTRGPHDLIAGTWVVPR